MIEITDLGFRYGSVQALHGLSLHVPQGCMFGLLGPNGAGKTTALSCVAGLKPPSEGSIRVAGLDVARQTREAQRLLGVAPQSLAIFPSLSVVQNLRFFGGLWGLGGAKLRERVDWGLALSQLEGKARARVDALSGGMKRRLNLACALLHDPRVILCDEPTTGVDPQSRNHLFETLRQLHREGRTIVYTTHYMEEVEALCSRVAILDQGKVVVEGALPDLLGGREKPARLELRLREGSSPLDVEAALRAAGLDVESVAEAPRSLETLFLELTGHALRDEEG